MNPSTGLPEGWEIRVRAALAVIRPDLADGTLRPLGEGVDSIALCLAPPTGFLRELPDRTRPFVLRLPRHDAAAAAVARDAVLLPELAGTLPLPVPRPAFTGPNPLGPGRFCGYPLVPGDALTEEEWLRRGLLDEPGPVRTIAAALDAVHAFPVARARELGVQDRDPRALFAEQLARLRADVVPRLPRGDAYALLGAFEEHLGDDAHFAYEPVFVHGDISLDHFLVTGRDVSGLIDFGDAAIGDPDDDLGHLWAEAGPGFVRRVQELRGLPYTGLLERKLRFRELADVAGDVLHEITGDPGRPPGSLGALRDLLARG